jgi:3'(2'), 5'-bisphosphate nucleotidase
VRAFDTATCSGLMDALTALSVSAASAIQTAAGAGEVRHKADGSPVTPADEAADALIRDRLQELAPSLPVISEEYAPRPTLSGEDDSYFLVDPLDGTREFVAGRAEYTINIALMQGGAPILGIITAPAFGLIWRGIVGRGAERIAFAAGQRSPPDAIQARQNPEGKRVILASRSHLEARTRAYLDRFPQAEVMQCGSSIKFCRLAEGVADLYPRLAPTHDWDIAAGHGILKAAGGDVRAPDGSPVVYGSADLLIPAFIASAGPFTA